MFKSRYFAGPISFITDSLNALHAVGAFKSIVKIIKERFMV